MENKGQKPLTHPDYQMIPGINIFNLSKWKRENEPYPPPRFKVGDVVILTTEATITQSYLDCDGEPLYALDIGPNGWSESSLTPVDGSGDEMDKG